MPVGHSINDGISKELASLSYVLVDDVTACALKERKEALLTKMDMKQAYRNIPVHPSDRAGLGMSWEGRVYIDSVLPFGLCSAPLLFSAVADALQWIMKSKLYSSPGQSATNNHSSTPSRPSYYVQTKLDISVLD